MAKNRTTTPDERLKEMRRELQMRKDVYPAWVTKKQINQHTADHREACLEDVIKDLEMLYNSRVSNGEFDPNEQLQQLTIFPPANTDPDAS